MSDAQNNSSSSLENSLLENSLSEKEITLSPNKSSKDLERSEKNAQRLQEREARSNAREEKRALDKAKKELEKSEPKVKGSSKLKTKSEKANSPRSSPRSSKPALLQPSATSFDFLNGSYQLTRNTRLLNYVVIGLFSAVLLLLLGTGVTNYLGNRDAKTTTNSLQEQKLAADKLVQSSGNGLSEGQIKTHLSTRAAEARGALGGEIDNTKVLGDIASVAPNGVLVSAIKIPTAAPVVATTPASGADSGPPAPSAGPSAPAPVAQSKLEITATASSYAELSAWIEALKSVAYLQGTDTKWTGAPGGSANGGISITTTATLGPAVSGSRLAEVNASLGVTPGANQDAQEPAAGGAK